MVPKLAFPSLHPPFPKNMAMGRKVIGDYRSLKKKRPKLTADVVLRQQGYYVHHLDSTDIRS